MQEDKEEIEWFQYNYDVIGMVDKIIEDSTIKKQIRTLQSFFTVLNSALCL